MTSRLPRLFAYIGFGIGLFYFAFYMTDNDFNFFDLPSVGYNGPDTSGMYAHQAFDSIAMWIDPGIWITFPAMDASIGVNIEFGLLNPLINGVIYYLIASLIVRLIAKV